MEAECGEDGAVINHQHQAEDETSLLLCFDHAAPHKYFSGALSPQEQISSTRENLRLVGIFLLSQTDSLRRQRLIHVPRTKAENANAAVVEGTFGRLFFFLCYVIRSFQTN